MEQRWIPVSERLPDADKYILVSFENFTISDIGRYETDKDGSGAFYPGNDDKSYVEYGLFVNAWMPMPEPYREGEDSMERLTAKNDVGSHYFPKCFGKCGGLGASDKCDNCENTIRICEKLGAYGFAGREKYYIVPNYASDLYALKIDPSTICWCTGLKDKNGNLIWENDIANCMDAECCGYISWNESEAGFYFDVLLEDGRFEEEHIYDYQDCMEVIGNTFDNPELLEV